MSRENVTLSRYITTVLLIATVIISGVAVLYISSVSNRLSDISKGIDEIRNLVAAPPTPKFEKKLVHMALTRLGRPDPHVETSTTPMVTALYDGLVQYDLSTPPKVKPGLATEWEISQDGKVYTFKLRKGAKFHSGNEVTADAVKFSMDRFRTMKRGMGFLWEGIVESGDTEVVDRYTVRFHLRKTFPPFLYTMRWLWIVDPAVMANKRAGSYGEFGDYANGWLMEGHDAGSGPYLFTEYKEGETCRMGRFNDYWGGWKENQIDVIEIWIIREEATMKLLFERDETGVAKLTPGSLSREFYKYIETQSAINKVVKAPSYSCWNIFFNTQSPPLDDVHLRRALSYAFDYETMLRDVRGAMGDEAMVGPMVPVYKDFISDKVVPYKRDLAKAKEELAKSKYKGEKLTFAYYTGLELYKNTGLLLQANAKEIGVSIEVTAVTWSKYTELVAKPETCPQIVVTSIAPNYPDPDDHLYNLYRSTNYPTSSSNPMHYKNPRVDDLLDAQRSTLDEKERIRLIKEAQVLINEDAPAIFCGAVRDLVAINKHIGNIRINWSQWDLYYVYSYTWEG